MACNSLNMLFVPLFSIGRAAGRMLMMHPLISYFVNHPSRCGARRLFRWRDHERDPGVPSVGPVLVGEFPVAFDIEITLRLDGQGNDEPELRANADHARLEAAHPIAGAAVATTSW